MLPGHRHGSGCLLTVIGGHFVFVVVVVEDKVRVFSKALVEFIHKDIRVGQGVLQHAEGQTASGALPPCTLIDLKSDGALIMAMRPLGVAARATAVRKSIVAVSYQNWLRFQSSAKSSMAGSSSASHTAGGRSGTQGRRGERSTFFKGFFGCLAFR